MKIEDAGMYSGVSNGYSEVIRNYQAYAQLCGFMRNIKDAKHIDYTMNNAYKLKLKREQREESITTILCTTALAVIVVAGWIVIYESFIYRYGV